MLYFLLAAGLVALDQAVKILIRANVELHAAIEVIPGVLAIAHEENPGAAFSLLREHTWLLTVISAAATLALAIVLARRVFRSRGANVLVAVILAGAAGNLIDRAVFQTVTDMFKTLFMDFPVFNVADICLTCGCIAMCVYVLFFYDRLEKKESAHDDPDFDC